MNSVQKNRANEMHIEEQESFKASQEQIEVMNKTLLHKLSSLFMSKTLKKSTRYKCIQAPMVAKI